MTMLSMPVLNLMWWLTGMLGQATPAVDSRRKTMRVWTLLLTMGTALTIGASPSHADIVAGPITNPANGHSYYLVSNSSWTASEAEAVTLGGHLATIRSAAENDWVYQTFSAYSGRRRDLWIGLNDLGTPGTFVWVSGDSSTYRNWNTGEPNQIGTDRYVYIYGPASAAPRRWNNAPASTTTPYGVVEVIRPLSSLAITGGPSTVYAFSMASYTATATFADSTTAAVTASWSVNPTTYVGIDGGGILTAGWVPSDQTITITASVTLDGVTRTDSETVTIVKQRETGTRYFSDDFETGLGKWEVSGFDWAIIASGCRSGANCITDSPSGNYPPDANSVITMQLPVNLSGSTSPVLSFWHRFSLPSGYGGDSGYVEVSTNGGLSWAVVPGGEFTGTVSTWLNQLLDLTAYRGSSVLLRFRLRDNSYTGQGDGWYIDDIEIKERDTQRTPFPFVDNFENGLGNWESSSHDWALIDADSRSAGHSITDSPAGNYPANGSARFTLAHPIDLSGTTRPVLSFWHKFSLPSGYGGDYGYVLISTNGGLSWAVVPGGDFTGTVSTWTHQLLDLTAYKEPSVLLMFLLADNSYTGQSDGWYIDDIEIREQDTQRLPFPFFDNFESGLANWERSGSDWALIDADYRSAGHSITDSPAGNYPANSSARFTLAHPIDLSGTTLPILSFWHKYSLPSGYGGDYGYVMISTDGGVSWAVVAGGQFTGAVSTWTHQLLDLTAYRGPSVLLMFLLADNSYTGQSDGWYIDDVRLYDAGVATPVITWANPASIVYGTPLGPTQLNATATVGGATVPGTFLYTPPAGTVLNAGAGQTLSVLFTPTDTTNYTTATATVTIDVTRATPVITWANPARIVYGTPLGPTQLNATAPIAGAFVYTPPAGTVLNAGAGQTLSVLFTPTDTTNYTTATATVTIDVTRAAAPGDFNGDSMSDILWRHATRGEVWLWPMDGPTRTAETYVRTVADTNFEIRGVADFTGDGNPDILWRNRTTGVIYLWPMIGSAPLSETYVATVDPAYDVAGTGDFDGDGRSDILWRHVTNGEAWIWLMDGATPLGQVYVDRVDPAYEIKGVGDLDGDGQADIVWHHATVGEVWVWLMDGTTRLSETRVGTVPDLGYQIEGVADHDGDGNADILWHHATTGEVWLWRMDGATRLAETWVGTVPDTKYRIVGTGDYDGNGKADILWHHNKLGEVWVWLMDGATPLSQTWVGTVADVGYQIVKMK